MAEYDLKVAASAGKPGWTPLSLPDRLQRRYSQHPPGKGGRGAAGGPGRRIGYLGRLCPFYCFGFVFAFLFKSLLIKLITASRVGGLYNPCIQEARLLLQVLY